MGLEEGPWDLKSIAHSAEKRIHGDNRTMGPQCEKAQVRVNCAAKTELHALPLAGEGRAEGVRS